MNNQKSSIQFLGDHPAYIDGFPKECERSCEGSLHFYPRRVLEVSLDELAYLKDKRGDIYKFLKIMSPQSVKKEAPLQPEPAKTEVLPEQPKEEPQEDTWTEKKLKKKGKGFEGV